jgi:hypothetical protein
VAVAVAVAVPGFFDGPIRALVVASGVLVLVWVPRLRVPAPLHRVVGVVAGASLWIFLTHFAVFPLLRPHVEPIVLFVVAFPIGIAAASLVEAATGPVSRIFRAATASTTVWARAGAADADAESEVERSRSAQPALPTGG